MTLRDITKNNARNKNTISKPIGAAQAVVMDSSSIRYGFSSFSLSPKYLNALLVVVCLFLSVSSLSSQKLGCSINKDICGFYEYCYEGSFLGECRNMLESEMPIELKTRNEVEFDSNIDAPIRIHKYNLHKKDLNEQYYDQDNDDVNSSEEQEDDENDLSSNKNDLLEKSLDIIQNQENDDDDDNEDDEPYNIDETNDDNDDDGDENISKRDMSESDEDTNSESEEDSSEDDNDNQDERDEDRHLSLLGQRKKRLILLEPRDIYYESENGNFDDEPKNIDELLRIYESEPGLLDNSIDLQNANGYNVDDDDDDDDDANDSNEDADDESLTNYQLPIVKKLIREEDDDDSLSEDVPLKLTDDSKENLLDIISSMKENLGNDDDGQDEEDDDSQYANFDENYADKFNNENGDDDENDNLNSYLRNIQKKSILDQEDDDDDEDSDENVLVKPLVYENSGVDQNGNKFHEKDVMVEAASKLNPNNKFESFYRTYDAVNDKNPFEYSRESQAQKELTVDDYFVPNGSPLRLTGVHYNLVDAKDSQAPMKLRLKNLKFQLNRGDDLIKEMNDVLTHQIDVNPVENVLSAFATHSFEPEMPPSLLPTFKEKLNENLNLAKKSYNGLDLHVNSHRVNPNLVSETKQSNEDEQIANVFGSMIGMPFGLEMVAHSEPTTDDYFVPNNTPLTHMKIGLHYNLNKENSIEKINSLKLQMDRADQIMQEINNVITHSHSSNPVEDVVNAFMTHHYEPEMPASFLPTFKQKLNENVELAKKTYDNLNLNVNTHRVNPNILAEEKVDTTKTLNNDKKDDGKKSTSHVKHHFDTNDYFEPILVDTDASKGDSNLKKLKTDLNKEQEEFIKNFYGKKSESKWYEANTDANMENDAEHSALNALLKNTNGKYDYVDSSYIFIELEKSIKDYETVTLLGHIASFSSLPVASFQDISVQDNLILFKINDPSTNSTQLIEKIFNHRDELKDKGFNVISCGLGREDHRIKINKHSEYILLVTIILCVSIASTLLILFAIFLVRRRIHLRNKLIDDVTRIKKPAFDDEERLVKAERQNTKPWYSFIRREQVDETPKQDYQELCRQRMHGTKHSKDSETPGMNTPGMNTTTKTTINSTPIRVNMEGNENNGESNRSSTSSWSEEPISTVNMDITTGHVILSYMEEHLNDKNRLGKEWKELENYEPDRNSTYVGSLPAYMARNRYSNIIPYDHNRVKIGQNSENDYINASFIMDDDPKNPVYIATQGPLMNTTNDFWQMVWEQGSVIIVNLCRTVENGSIKCNQYWPSNGFEVNDKFEVHLVSEHVWCEDYLVRNFFLKNLETSQTRTVTQFHFLTWAESGNPQNVKTVLDFRRKVNKSYKSKSSPIIVHCNDGIGRTGTYIMIDMVLNKIARGAKEIDLAATLEYLRDQRPGIIKTKGQFEFSFAVVTEEVQNMLKALNP